MSLKFNFSCERLRVIILPGREWDHSLRTVHTLSKHFKSIAYEPPTDFKTNFCFQYIVPVDKKNKTHNLKLLGNSLGYSVMQLLYFYVKDHTQISK